MLAPLTMSSEFQSRCAWCRRWYRSAVVTADEAEPSCFQARPLRYPTRTRSARPQFAIVVQMLRSAGVAADISHINTKSEVKGYDPTPSGLRECLTGAEIVLIPAGVPRKPGMTRDGKRLDSYHEP